MSHLLSPFTSDVGHQLASDMPLSQRATRRVSYFVSTDAGVNLLPPELPCSISCLSVDDVVKRMPIRHLRWSLDVFFDDLNH